MSKLPPASSSELDVQDQGRAAAAFYSARSRKRLAEEDATHSRHTARGALEDELSREDELARAPKRQRRPQEADVTGPRGSQPPVLTLFDEDDEEEAHPGTSGHTEEHNPPARPASQSEASSGASLAARMLRAKRGLS